MTRVLYVGDLNPYTRSEQRYRAILSLGVDVTGISFAPVTHGAGEARASWYERARSRVGWPADTTGVNGEIASRVEHERYDVLWVDKAPSVRDSTLRRIAARPRGDRPALVFHSDDDMFARHNQTGWFRRALPLYDLVVTAKSFNQRPGELPALGARCVLYVPQAFDPEFHRPVDVDDDDRRALGGEVGFVGTFEQDRADRMLHLADHGIVVRVFGNGWSRLVGHHPNLRVEDRAIYGDEYIRCLSATDVNLGFLRKSNRDQHTSRTLDIPACGAFYLAERTAEQQTLFGEGVEADYFGSDRELLDKVRYYLEHDEARRRIAAAGRRRCVDSGYDHARAVHRVIERALGAA